MLDRALYTACSNKFFPSVLNLLGSLRVNYPHHPPVFIYDLGLAHSFRRELSCIPGVTLVPMPHFSPFWRSCYTWKPYIFAHPLARLNFYMDAGSQVLRPLDEIFSIIEREGYICVQQDVPLYEIAPQEYRYLFSISESLYDQPTMTAGLFGFAAGTTIVQSVNELFLAAQVGLCLGHSAGEPWKNRGPNKTKFVRSCRIFRFDTSVFNLILRKNFGSELILHSGQKYGGYLTPHDHPQQLIWNFRMNYSRLEYLAPGVLHAQFSFTALFNRIIVQTFFWMRKINFILKRMHSYR